MVGTALYRAFVTWAILTVFMAFLAFQVSPWWILWFGAPGVVFFVSMADGSKRKRADEEKQRADRMLRQKAASEKSRLAAIQAKEQDRVARERLIAERARIAASEYNSLPSNLERLSSHAESARRHFANGAFSPFWASIEECYADLGRYYETVGRIAAAIQQHDNEVSEYARRHGPMGDLAKLPLTSECGSAAMAGARAEQDIAAMVYEAQKHPTYSQIWEQRRTTSAVVAGFKNLGEAVAQMGSSMSRSLSTLTTQLQANQDRLREVVVGGQERLAASIDASSSNASAAVIGELRQMGQDVNKTTWYLKEAWKRDALGL